MARPPNAAVVSIVEASQVSLQTLADAAVARIEIKPTVL